MLMCRSCGQQVASNGFCSNCMTYSNVKNVKDEDELGLAKTVSSSIVKPPLPTIHVEDEGKHLAYSSNILNTYFCKYCDEKFQSKDILQRHIEDDHVICKYCHEYFQSKILLKQHIKDVHATCKYCGEYFQSKDILQQHLKNVHYNCKYCDKNFQSEILLKQHIKDKHSICKYCGEYFQSEILLNIHIKDTHIICKFCEKEFQSINNLKKHIKDGHLICKYCHKKFKSANGLEQHIKDVHNNNQTKENPKSSVPKPHSMKKLWNDVQLRESNRNPDEQFFREYDEQKVTILAEWIKRGHYGCGIIEPNDNGTRIQKWIQGTIRFKIDDMPRFYRKRHTSSFNPITLDEKNRDFATLIVKDIKKGWG
ncbi:MAG: C2H2-type zinc finger protein [Methanococcoides sp.]|nr:C2H2-type zinc finger protein [Methanococcoides sp.]